MHRNVTCSVQNAHHPSTDGTFWFGVAGFRCSNVLPLSETWQSSAPRCLNRRSLISVSFKRRSNLMSPALPCWYVPTSFFSAVLDWCAQRHCHDVEEWWDTIPSDSCVQVLIKLRFDQNRSKSTYSTKLKDTSGSLSHAFHVLKTELASPLWRFCSVGGERKTVSVWEGNQQHTIHSKTINYSHETITRHHPKHPNSFGRLCYSCDPIRWCQECEGTLLGFLLCAHTTAKENV